MKRTLPDTPEEPSSSKRAKCDGGDPVTHGFNIFADKEFFCGAVAPHLGPATTQSMRRVANRFTEWLPRRPLVEVVEDMLSNVCHDNAFFCLLISLPCSTQKQLAGQTADDIHANDVKNLVLKTPRCCFDACLDFFFTFSEGEGYERMVLIIEACLQRRCDEILRLIFLWGMKRGKTDWLSILLAGKVVQPRYVREPWGFPSDFALLVVDPVMLRRTVLAMLYTCLLLGEETLHRFRKCVACLFPRDFPVSGEFHKFNNAEISGKTVARMVFSSSFLGRSHVNLVDAHRTVRCILSRSRDAGVDRLSLGRHLQ